MRGGGRRQLGLRTAWRRGVEREAAREHSQAPRKRDQRGGSCRRRGQDLFTGRRWLGAPRLRGAGRLKEREPLVVKKSRETSPPCGEGAASWRAGQWRRGREGCTVRRGGRGGGRPLRVRKSRRPGLGGVLPLSRVCLEAVATQGAPSVCCSHHGGRAWPLVVLLLGLRDASEAGAVWGEPWGGEGHRFTAALRLVLCDGRGCDVWGKEGGGMKSGKRG
jgi:hypothetical protein